MMLGLGEGEGGRRSPPLDVGGEVGDVSSNDFESVCCGLSFLYGDVDLPPRKPRCLSVNRKQRGPF